MKVIPKLNVMLTLLKHFLTCQLYNNFPIWLSYDNQAASNKSCYYTYFKYEET